MKRGVIPKGDKLVILATSIRWFGWGLFEALLPIFLFQFANTYAETGLLSSIYNILFFLTLPLVGMLADRISARTILIIGLIIYPFIGISYFLAGALGLMSLIVIARSLNGVSWAFDSVGRDIYFRRHSPKKKISSIFGYFETYANLAWIIGLIISLALLPFIKLQWLFLALIPTTLIALFIVARLKNDKKENLGYGLHTIMKKGAYLGLYKEVRGWNSSLKLIGSLTFFFGLISTIISFFIPIYAYTQGATYSQIVIITLFLTAPSLFGEWLGRFADKKRGTSIFFGLIILTLILLALFFIEKYTIYLIAAFAMGIVLELVQLANDGVATRFARREHYGRISSALEGLNELGSLAGPIVLGLMVDAMGISSTSLIAAGATLLMLIIVGFKRKLLGISIK